MLFKDTFCIGPFAALALFLTVVGTNTFHLCSTTYSARMSAADDRWFGRGLGVTNAVLLMIHGAETCCFIGCGY
jgi:hypothetical protein